MAAPEAPLYYQGVARTSAAFRLLKQMGWQEGEGLGKEKQGITEHVRVNKKKDNSGIGVDAQQRAASNWTFNTSAFDSILKNLKVIAADTNEKDDKKGNAVEEVKEKEKKSPVKKVTRPQGRYKNRESGKIIQGKSQADLDAILGYGVKPKEVWSGTNSCKSEAQCVPTEPSSCSENASHNNDEGNKKYSNILQKNPSKSNVAEVSTADAPKLEKSAQAPKENPVKSNLADWWGTKHGFVRAGELGQLGTNRKGSAAEKNNDDESENSQAVCRNSFCEQDQENLYKLVQDKATKGRQGLGIADRPKKIGGAHWKGQKVVLDNDDEEEDDPLEALSEDPMNTDEVCNLNKTDECKRKAAPIECDEDIEEPKTKKSRHEDKQSWKKQCKQILKETPGQTMSIKRLLKQIVENTDLFPTDNSNDYSEQLGLFKEKINKSSKFVVQGKKVSLASA